MQKVFQLHVALLLVLCISLTLPPCHSSEASVPFDCCFDFFRNRVNKNLITSYHRTDPRCHLSGIVLQTTRGRRICVDATEQWVQNIVQNLEKKAL